jgi:transcriptional regulator with XRE-family HTH domain
MQQEDREPFSNALVAALRAREMSQNALGEAVGVTQSMVSDWGRGTREPSQAQLELVEQALSLAPGDLTRLLGYLPLSYAAQPSSVYDALEADAHLDRKSKDALMVMYLHMVATDRAERAVEKRLDRAAELRSAG